MTRGRHILRGYAQLVADVQEGAEAPDFTLRADDGREVTLSSLRGRQVVLYFYPKDDTPATI